MSRIRSLKIPTTTRQQGMALVIVLLLLLVITLIGLAAMRGTVMQERMSGNATSRSIAFQAAEAVLREAEADAASVAESVIPASGCSGGYCAMPVDGAESLWLADNFWTSGSGFKNAVFEIDDVDDGAILRYVIEDMGEGTGDAAAGDECPGGNAFDMTGGCGPAAAGAAVRYYRIVAFSRLSNGSEVILQSTYQVP
ncbi:PilX N-terminal domain-containing pilus assembly protein [Arenimonas sp.]|uniref:pilus assembly PilX family protein n=1 Tax=Arenimonas sp. TaxID=1872635 RepID=UPI0035B42D41